MVFRLQNLIPDLLMDQLTFLLQVRVLSKNWPKKPNVDLERQIILSKFRLRSLTTLSQCVAAQLETSSLMALKMALLLYLLVFLQEKKSSSHGLKISTSLNITFLRYLSAQSQMKFKQDKNKKYIFLLKQTGHFINVSILIFTSFTAMTTGTPGKPDYQGPSGVKCSFGTFGNSMGMYINSTTVLCLSPAMSEQPEDYAT